jgi:hypothetical protein
LYLFIQDILVRWLSHVISTNIFFPIYQTQMTLNFTFFVILIHIKNFPFLEILTIKFLFRFHIKNRILKSSFCFCLDVFSPIRIDIQLKSEWILTKEKSENLEYSCIKTEIYIYYESSLVLIDRTLSNSFALYLFFSVLHQYSNFLFRVHGIFLFFP